MKKNKGYIRGTNEKNVWLLLVLTVLVTAPMLFQGIMCNDELQTRYWRKVGLFSLLKHYKDAGIKSGRIQATISDVRLISFLTTNMYINRFIDIMLIVIAIAIFIYFIYIVNGDKNFAFFVGIFTLVSLPITFEHGAPNAFVAVTVIPLILMLISFILFYKYMKRCKRAYFVFSMICYIYAMMQYEFNVTYILMFYALIFKFEFENKSVFVQYIKRAIVPTIITVLYIIFYFGMHYLIPSQYAGTTVGFVSISKSLNIIMVLLKSSLPGYFLFNDKYKYLEKFYMKNFDNVEYMFIILFLIFISFLCVVHSFFNKENNSKRWNWLQMIVAFVFMIVPSLPNSISALYQDTVSDTFFTWLPVSIFLFFASSFLIASLIWNILKNIKKSFIFLPLVLIALFICRVQFMNYVVANQQYKDFLRLEAIEHVFDAEILKEFDGMTIYSEDIFETRNLLGIHGSYWTDYANSEGLDIKVVKGKDDEAVNLYYSDNGYFVFSDCKNVLVISPRELEGYNIVQISENQFVCAMFLENEIKNEYYIYAFKVEGEELEKASIDYFMDNIN